MEGLWRIRSLGSGAVGEVFLCAGLKRDLSVVKRVREEMRVDPETMTRFHREAAWAAGLAVPGLARVNDFGLDDAQGAWIAMEFIDGLPPNKAIAPWDAPTLAYFLRSIGSVIDELHGRGIVHRDIKPENIMLRSTKTAWEPMLLDLGIAKWLAMDGSTYSGAVFGTPYYMSPEQFQDSKRVGPPTDRYALAVLAFELLTGELPFQGRHFAELMSRHLESEIPVVVRPAEPKPYAALSAFMRRGLAKNGLDRFESAADLAQAFEEAAGADGIWDQDSALEPLFPPIRRQHVQVRLGEQIATFDLRQVPVLLGRHEASQFVIDSGSLSRAHACIYVERGRVWVADLWSQNGSSLGGRKLEAGRPLALASEGDVPLRMFDLTVQLQLVGSIAP